MTESDARRVLLLRAFEQTDHPAWQEADRDAVTREAGRADAGAASPEAWIAQRARLGVARLAAREPAVGAALAAGGWHPGLATGAVALAALAGLATAPIGGPRINILAPPLLALLAWNLAVYLALALHAATGRRGPRAAAIGPLRAAMLRGLRAAGRALAPRADAGVRAALARFAADWAQVARGLYAARIAFVLHLAAAALAAGVLASMYLRGLAFEYRAGWDSTFLDATGVHALLSVVLGPASALARLPLPDVPQLAALRLSAGGSENAARWIHLYALTVAGAVLLPRLALAVAAAARARRLAHALPVPLDAPDFRRLLRRHAGKPLAVAVLPYSYTVAPHLREGLGALLERGFGQPVHLTLADSLPLGAEDALAQHWPAGEPPGIVVALFALTATPERETHGAFVQALVEQAGEAWTPLVLVDESGFRERFGHAPDAARLQPRRTAWRRMLAELGREPVFADLAHPDSAAVAQALEPLADTARAAPPHPSKR